MGGGGNCELTKKGEVYTTENGVTIVGYVDLPAKMARQASEMYGKNIWRLFEHIGGKTEKAKGFKKNLLKDLDLPKTTTSSNEELVARIIVCCRNGKDHEAPPIPQ